MSDPNEPSRPEGSSDAPPPPPPPSDPYGGAASGGGGYGQANYGGGGSSGGGYGAPPESPYGQPAPSGYSAPDAVGFGWRHFKASPPTLLVPVLVIGVVLIVVIAVVELLVGAIFGTGGGIGTRLVAAGIASAVISLVSQILVAGLYKGGLSVADGHPFALGKVFEGWDKTQVVIAGIIIGLLTLVGTILCYFPALLVGYFTQFTLPYIVDKNLSATDAIKASVRLCRDNLGDTIVWYLLSIVCILAGTVACVVGLLVAVPVVLVGLGYTFRRLQSEPVVEPTAS